MLVLLSTYLAVWKLLNTVIPCSDVEFPCSIGLPWFKCPSCQFVIWAVLWNNFFFFGFVRVCFWVEVNVMLQMVTCSEVSVLFVTGQCPFHYSLLNLNAVVIDISLQFISRQKVFAELLALQHHFSTLTKIWPCALTFATVFILILGLMLVKTSYFGIFALSFLLSFLHSLSLLCVYVHTQVKTRKQ